MADGNGPPAQVAEVERRLEAKVAEVKAAKAVVDDLRSEIDTNAKDRVEKVGLFVVAVAPEC